MVINRIKEGSILISIKFNSDGWCDPPITDAAAAATACIRVRREYKYDSIRTATIIRTEIYRRLKD